MRSILMLPALAVAWMGLAVPSSAAVKPNTLCSEGMVLQQKSQANVWGTADQGEKVSVEFRGKTACKEPCTPER